MRLGLLQLFFWIVWGFSVCVWNLRFFYSWISTTLDWKTPCCHFSEIDDIHFNISLQDLDIDLYINGSFEIKGIRAKYQYSQLDNIDIKTKAMDTMKSKLRNITFDTNSENNLNHPIAYTFMFIQWEANRVISHELIRNLSLTFGTIAIGK